jgi:hypothetical protein
VQTLGGSHTVTTAMGDMLRIAGKDADAVGEEIAPAPQSGAPAAAEGPVDIEKMIWDQLRMCFDPGVNMVDLGLVYVCLVAPLPDGGTRRR